MPISGKTQPSPAQPFFFKSLREFDDWTPGTAPKRYDGIVKYSSRKPAADVLTRGKLLVCHDYKGGYTESLFDRCYTYNFWSSCDTFIYFSHHRVTVPPPGWISAAHRQGVKMLGTLIFEGGGEQDCLRLIVGKMPTSKTGQVEKGSTSRTLPLTPYYAKRLAELAAERGFDGYLLNFECPLGGGVEQTRALSAWITILQSEILEKVGSHGETIWYDSVIINGQLAWQDRLNSLNLPFFLSSTSLFSNYTWRTDYPARSVQYFTSLDASLIGNTPASHSHRTTKTIQDIYMGVDVWGRGSHGGGGFGSYKAITHIAPESLGLSVALFGQAWTWESEQDKPEWTWDRWWEYESKLWIGPVSGPVEVPEAPRRKDEPECLHGPFVPIASFFPRHPPPDPADLCFHTTFCPGTGLAWFVDGIKVYQNERGWTDVDKQTSVGDLLWPAPKLFWDEEREDSLPAALSSLYMKDAWNGGNSVKFSLSFPTSTHELAAYRPLWLPIQSLYITPQKPYFASIVYKVDPLPESVETEFALNLKPFSDSQDTAFVCNIVTAEIVELPGGWTKLSIQFNTSSSDGITVPSTNIAIGLVVAVVTEDTEQSFDINILLGQLNVAAYVPETFREEDTIILWADYTASSSNGPAKPLSGTLSWEVATSFPRVTSINIASPEDPVSAWNQQPTITWFPSFLYFNIYAQVFTDEYNIGGADTASWIGTSGWDGQKSGFDVLFENLPFVVPPNRKVRFYIRGVNDRGEVMKWEKSAYVDLTG
ncbi:glycoside hydrolase family 85 protein [Pholiota conissans]|uniref:Glycoside hydrolase family 85 protein n=1 Tax=Pholiota conissans TaxID=109636 RepID=A0A9P6CWN3_9AGAR|nr:glycoside hydrolase family 85 protein [Pholiota conissans]